MEGLAPTLELCIEMRMLIERGESAYLGLKNLLTKLEPNIRAEVIRLILQFEQGREEDFDLQKMSPYRRELFRIIMAGLSGEPIAVRLKEIEVEVQAACDLEIEEFISALPIRAMMPVLLMQFPAFLILMFGPIVQEITRSFTV